MPSHKPVRTYQKKTRFQLDSSSNSVQAINALFAQNLTKRLKSGRKAKLKVKELPPRTDAYLTDESLNVEPNDTFDRVLRGEVYNKVKVGNVGKIRSSDSESSKSKLQISVSYHSPVMTRRRKKNSVVITEISDNSKETMSKSSTLDKPVTSSLSIEKPNKPSISGSLSYIKLPKITENEVVNNNTEESYQPIFSETFRERQSVHSSTPCVAALTQKIVADPISPITKSDSSDSPQLIEKSYDQIREWDKNFPNLEETPQGPPGRRRKLSTMKAGEDWKLHCPPQVCLKWCDIIGDQKTKSKRLKKSGDEELTDFRGFSEEEQLNSSKESSHFQNLLESVSLGDKRQRLEKSLPKLKCDPRKRSRNGSLKTPVKKSKSALKQRVSKRSVPKRKSKRLEINSQTRKKIKTDEKLKESKPSPILKNKRSLKEKRPSEKVETKLDLSEEETTLQKRSTRTLRNNRMLKSRKSSQVEKGSNSSSEDLKASPKIFTRSRLKKEQTQPYITLRRREISYPEGNNKKTDKISNSRKTKMKKPLCMDITEDILSEKEVSYSHSSFDFSSESSRSKISYTTEELKQEKEIRLPKIATGDKSEVMTVDLHDFNNFMQSYYVEDTENKKEEMISVPKEVPAVSIITLSDDSEFEDSVTSRIIRLRPSAIKDEKVSSTETSEETIKSVQNDACQNQTDNKSADFSQTPNSANNTKNSKIIILSNISLGFSKDISSLTDSLMRIQHDHLYCSPVLKPQQKLPATVDTNKPAQNTSFTRDHSNLSDIIESSFTSETDAADGKLITKKANNRKFTQKSIKLKPGKSYRRSLSLLRRSSVIVDSGQCQRDCKCLKCLFRLKFNPDVSKRTSQIVPTGEHSLSKSILESYARSSACYVRGDEEEDRVDNLDESVRNLSLNERRKSILQQQLVPVTAKEVVLRRCGQTEVLPFEECYPRSALQNCQKIGEGVYGEVFLYRNQNGGTSVMKIIPIEGDLIVNGERQKKFDEILSEIVIAMELSNLRNNKRNTTSGFSEVQKVRCTQGNYPDRLIDLWDLYDETKGSENDSPQIFSSNQMYIVLELANGGRDLESFVFNNAAQAFAMFKQTACALAVAENQLKFEHRDLHWGNILLSGVDKDKTLQFRLDGKEIEVETFGVEVAIIDFTLSRIEFEGVVIFNDLSLDNELFDAEGDYQFEIYRAMQKSNRNEWQHFEPYTNILWLHYVLDKAVSSALRYKNPRTKIHKEYLSKLKQLKDEILSYNSVVEFVSDKFV